MSCTPTPTSTRWGSQTTSTQHSFQTNVPTIIVLGASQTSSVTTSCVSTNSPAPSPTATNRGNSVETSSANGDSFWQGFRGARHDAEETASADFPAVIATATPSVSLGRRQNGECAAYTTITNWVDTPAETRTTQTEVMTWTWETFETQIPLETLFAPCPTPETVTQTRQPPPSSTSQPPRQPASAVAVPLSTSTPNQATSSTTSLVPQQPSQPNEDAAAPSVSSTQSSSSTKSIASAAAMQSPATSDFTSSVTSATAVSSAGGAGVINNSAVPPETKTLPGSNSDKSSSAETEEESVDAGAVAGGVFGALAGLALLLLAYRWYMQRRRQAKRARNTWYEKSYESSEDYDQPSASRFSSSSQTQPTSITGKINNARHMAQASLSGPFPPFFNTVRNSLIAPFGSSFKATPLHPAGSHPTAVVHDEGPSLLVPPVFTTGVAAPLHPSPLRTVISPPQPFIGDTYAASGQVGYAGPPVPVINVHEPSSRGTSFAHDPTIVDSFPLPPEQQLPTVDERGASMYSTPSYYGDHGPHTSGQFEYSEYQNSARESLATINPGDRDTKAWYDKELWDGGGAREGVQSASGQSLYGGIGTSEAGDRQVRPGFAM